MTFCPKLVKIACCQMQARFSQLWSQLTSQQKGQSEWNFDPLQSSTQMSHFYYQLSLKTLSFGVKVCQKCSKMYFRGSVWLLGEPWNTHRWLNLPDFDWYCLPHMLAHRKLLIIKLLCHSSLRVGFTLRDIFENLKNFLSI